MVPLELWPELRPQVSEHLVGPSEQTAEQMSEQVPQQVPQPGGERRHCQDWVLEQQRHKGWDI